MSRPRASLGVKLFAGVFGTIVVVFLSFSYFSAQETSEAWEQSFEQQATQTTAVIERVLRQGMLLGKKESVHAAMRDVATAPGIEVVRIYDKQGVVRFSTNEGEIGTRAARNDEVCAICHGEHFRTARLESFTRTLRDRGVPIMGQARLIRNGAQCAGTGCHEPPDKKEYLGVMDFQTSMIAVEQANLDAQRSTAWAAVVMAITGGIVTMFLIFRLVRRPILELVRGTREVAAGNLETRLHLEQSAEAYELARAFNQMAGDLSRARERSEKWEENLARAIDEKTAELAAAHRRMLHMEKMASLGKLAATVAHELNNPLAGIVVYAKLLARDLKEPELPESEKKETLRYVEVVRQESSRCGDIVRNLLSFARQSKNVFAEHGLNTIVDRSMMTVQHLMKTNSIECRVGTIDGDDRLFCDQNELQQALVALLVNAAEAMPNGGELRIDLTGEADTIVVDVADTGVGIPPEILPEIFEPFVSTKGDEKGVGLGLSVVYGIVRRHEGSIDVESEPGKGTTFRVTLPRRPTGDAGATAASSSDTARRASEPRINFGRGALS
ncbi:MAG: HAMP domain-containing histidine kinase [Deltaproteobacteria bacterium]|nr:HAMP domain-containing histidine kinase [Deltaproteobacteria bacterium]